MVRQAYLFSDCVLSVFNFRDEVGDLAEIRFALQAQTICDYFTAFATPFQTSLLQCSTVG